MKQAVIDIGSNSMRLTVYETNAGSFTVLFKDKVMAGLAGYVEEGVLSREGIARACQGLLSFQAVLEALDIRRAAVFATASLRNIKNTHQAVSLLEAAAGYPNSVDSKSGMNPCQQLKAIYDTVPRLVETKGQLYRRVSALLETEGIRDLTYKDLTAEEKAFAADYFHSSVLPILSPQIVGLHHPSPHLVNKALYVAALLRNKSGKKSLGFIPVPLSLPSLVLLPESRGRFLRIETILRQWAPTLFGKYKVEETCLICATRNADLSFDTDKFEDNEEDFRLRMTKLLKKRAKQSIVRLEVNQKPSQAGVEVEMIIRGICCLRPEVLLKTENIHITSIVGRYLEHARIYTFGRGKEAEYFIASADLMTRNLQRRVEIACPVWDEEIKEQLRYILDTQLRDNAKASFLQASGAYLRKEPGKLPPLDSQMEFMQTSLHRPEPIPISQERGSLLKDLLDWLKKPRAS